MTITFKVDDVAPKAPTPRYYNGDMKKRYVQQGLARAGIKSETVEAYRFNYEDVSFYDATQNSFVRTAMEAFTDHSPLAIAPDDIWLLCAQAISKHISRNPEDCRRALVDWDGKKTIQVVNDDFYKGSPDNNWQREFSDFAIQIEELIGKKADLLNPTFSTTGPIEKAAIQVQMMAALAPYMEYRMMTMCGVPTVTLLGTPDDWSAISERVAAFAEFYPAWAHDPMLEATAQFENSSNGIHDMEFWKNFFKRSYGSGGTRINGWIGAFFPYMDGKPNKMMEKDFRKMVLEGPLHGYDVGDFSSSVGTAPMTWNCRGTIYNMALTAGMFGTTAIDVPGVELKSYKTVIGWAVGA